MLSSIAVPGTNGFAGEFLIILGAFQEALHSQLLPVTPWNPSLGINENLNNMSGWLISWRVVTTTLVVLAIFGAVFIAVFMLSMFRRVMLGPSENKANSTIADLNFREVVYLAPLAVLVFAIGFFPNTMMDKTHASIDAYIAHVRPAVADARAPISEKIKRSRKGLASVDPGAPPGATRQHASLPAAPAHAALPQGGR